MRFVVIGKFPERFINIVTKSGLSIWDTENKNDNLYASMYVRDYKSIRPLAKKSRVKLKVKSKSGLPFFIRKYKFRVGVLIGILLFTAITMVMSNFVWTIDIVGLQTISEAKVRSVLKDNGLYVGMYKGDKSFKTIERDTMLLIDDIGWMSVNVINSHASVEIKEKAKSPKVEDYHQPANVKAKRDGLIISINTTEGVSYFESGSAVVKDQLIVSAVVEDKLKGVKLVRANAEVLAKTKREETFCVKKEKEALSFSEEKERKYLNIFTLRLPITFAFADENNSLVRYKTENVKLFDTMIPLSVTTQTTREISSDLCKVDENKAKETLLKYCALYEGFVLNECDIKNREYNYYETQDCYYLKATFDCEEDIAYKQEINIDNVDLTQIAPTDKED